MTTPSQCLKCNGQMHEGYILEVGHANVRLATTWVSGRPEPSFFTGLTLKDREQHTIRSFRCVECGYLESYAGAA